VEGRPGRGGNRGNGIQKLRCYLDGLYLNYNRREYISPDPLQFLYDYSDPGQREIVGLLAASLAYGKVAQILKSVSLVLERMGDPIAFVNESDGVILTAFQGLKHRFTTGDQVGRLLLGVKRAIMEFGSLKECFARGISTCDGDYGGALERFVEKLSHLSGCDFPFLLPRPSGGSPCKRLFLYLRWMIRKDQVDPGCWDGMDPSLLVVPLDTHMRQIAVRLGATTGKTPGIRMAREITGFFRKIDPSDPVKYDFVLTRFGIRQDMTIDDLDLSDCSSG